MKDFKDTDSKRGQVYDKATIYVNEKTQMPEFIYVKGSKYYYGIELYDLVVSKNFPESSYKISCNA